MTTKIAISLPDHLVTAARAEVAAGRAASLSAFIADALAYQADRERLADVLRHFDTNMGRVSEADLAWADHELGIVAK